MPEGLLGIYYTLRVFISMSSFPCLLETCLNLGKMVVPRVPRSLAPRCAEKVF